MSSAQPDSDDRPFMGGSRSGVWFGLTATDDGEPPFLVLDDTGRFSRVLHGGVRLGNEHTLLEVAVKMQRDAYQFSGAEHATLTNAAIDDMWQREVADYRRIVSFRQACLTRGMGITSFWGSKQEPRSTTDARITVRRNARQPR